MDLPSAGQHGEASAEIFKLAHIARPGQFAQRGEGASGKSLGFETGVNAGLGEEVGGQRGDVVTPFAQRRQAQSHHIEAMQQVGAELAALDLGFQILVGCGDDAHIAADQLAAADAIELSGGKHAQQARLQGQRHVANLVEEQAWRRVAPVKAPAS